jgi:TonB family protein
MMVKDTKVSRDVLGPLRPSSDDLAFVDDLTGLFNQRLLGQLLDDRWPELVSLAGSIAIVMIDLDLFKEVNDRYGHLSGDEVLRTTAEILRRTFRASDLLFRYGGDEFVVLLPGATASEAEALGDRAREAMRAHEFLDQEEQSKIELPLSFSIGVAAYPADGSSGREVLSSADDRLYIEKRIQLTARRKKRVLVRGALALVAAIGIAVALLVLIEGGNVETEVPSVAVEPSVPDPVPSEDAERAALLLEIAELQRQIELLRATRPDVSTEHSRAQIVELEKKVLELTEQLKTRGDEPELPEPVQTGQPSQRPAVAEPAPRQAPPSVKPETGPPPAPQPVVVVPPRLKKRVMPIYPLWAKERGLEATIDLDILVDENGRVAEATLRGETVGFGFEDAARAAALRSEWSPGERNGVATAMRTTLQVRFQIER